MFDLEHSRMKLEVVRLLGAVPKDPYIDLDSISIEGWVLIESAGGKHYSIVMPILIPDSLDVFFVTDVDTQDLRANPNLLTNEPLGLVKDKTMLETQLGLDDELGIDGSPVLPAEFLDMPKSLSSTHFVSQKEAEANLNMLTKNLFDLVKVTGGGGVDVSLHSIAMDSDSLNVGYDNIVGNEVLEVNTTMLAQELFVAAKDRVNVKDIVENHLGLDDKIGMYSSSIMGTEVSKFVDATMLFSLAWENILVGFVGDLPSKSTDMLRTHSQRPKPISVMVVEVFCSFCSVSLLMKSKISMIYSESFGIGAVNPILIEVFDLFGNAIFMHFKIGAGVVRQVIDASNLRANHESLWSRNGMETRFRIRNTEDNRTVTANGISCDTDGIVGIYRTNGSVKSELMVMWEMSCRAFGSSKSSNCGFSEGVDSSVGLSDTPLEEQLMNVLYKGHGLLVSSMWTANIHMAGCKTHKKRSCVEAALSILKDFSRAALEAEIGDTDMGSQVDFELVRGHFCPNHSLWAIFEPKLFLFGCMRFDKTGKGSVGCFYYANWFAGGLNPNVCSFCWILLCPCWLVENSREKLLLRILGCEPGGCPYIMSLA